MKGTGIVKEFDKLLYYLQECIRKNNIIFISIGDSCYDSKGDLNIWAKDRDVYHHILPAYYHYHGLFPECEIKLIMQNPN